MGICKVKIMNSKRGEGFLKTCLSVSVRSRSNWKLELLAFEERVKPEFAQKNLWEQRGKPPTNSTHIWIRRRNLVRRVLSSLRHPCTPRRKFCTEGFALQNGYFTWILKGLCALYYWYYWDYETQKVLAMEYRMSSLFNVQTVICNPESKYDLLLEFQT